MEGLEIIQMAKQMIPQPYESRPQDNSVYIKYGTDNLYPQFILNLYQKCPIHASIINTKASYIIGDGLKYKDTGEPFELKPNAVDTLNEFLDKVVKDFLIHNKFAIETQYNELTFRTQTLAYNHVPAQTIRINKEKTKFWYSEDWALRRTPQFTWERWQLDNPDASSKLFYVDGYIPSLYSVYSEPDYMACVESIITDMAIRTFNRNNIQSNFSPSKIITYFLGESVPKSIQDEIKYKLDKYFSGAGEKYMLVFANPEQEKLKVENLDANTWDRAYEVTREATKQDIYEGHQINAALIGREVAGRLGNTQELELAYEIFKANYVQNKRSQIESALSVLFGVEVEFADRPLFKTRLADTTKEKVYTINELRAIENLPAIDNGDRLLVQTPATPTQVPGQFPVQQQLSAQEYRELTIEDFKSIEHLGYDKSGWTKIMDGTEEMLDAMRPMLKEELGTVVTVLYDYVVRANAAPLKTESRPFCREMEASNKYWSRQEIQQMTQQFGYDVYKFGGHWYRNPETGIITESCRHQWKPVIVRQNR
jgi:hypothetical protein